MKDKLAVILKEALTFVFKQKNVKANWQLQESTTKDAHFNKHMCFVVMASDSFVLTIKFHVSQQNLVRMWERWNQNHYNDPSTNRALDQFKEMQNIIIRRIGYVFHHLNVSTQSSIAFSMPGYMEIFFEKSSSQCFTLEDKDISFQMTIALSKLNEEKAVKIDESVQKLSNQNIQEIFGKLEQNVDDYLI